MKKWVQLINFIAKGVHIQILSLHLEIKTTGTLIRTIRANTRTSNKILSY